MNSQKFVDALRSEVMESSVQEVINVLISPPGRRPAQDLVSLSEWFNDIPIEDREKIQKIMAMVSRHAVFGFLCVLDGVRIIENGDSGGVFELWYEKSGQSVLLNEPKADLLHDLL